MVLSLWLILDRWMCTLARRNSNKRVQSITFMHNDLSQFMCGKLLQPQTVTPNFKNWLALPYQNTWVGTLISLLMLIIMCHSFTYTLVQHYFNIDLKALINWGKFNVWPLSLGIILKVIMPTQIQNLIRVLLSQGVVHHITTWLYSR